MTDIYIYFMCAHYGVYELVLAQVWFSFGGGPWQPLPPFHSSGGSEMTFECALQLTTMRVELIGHLKPCMTEIYLNI